MSNPFIQLDPEGISGSAIFLDGRDDYISITGQMEDVRTISFWFKPGNPYGLRHESVSLFYRDGNSSEPGVDEFGLHFMDGGLYDDELVFSNGQSNVLVRTDNDDWEEKWYHVAVTIDPINGTKMYLNGNLTSTNSETTPINVDAQTSIGRHGILDMRYFDTL